MRRVLLLGLGNELLTDDGIGLRIARVARERLQGQAGVAVAESAEMGLALLDLMDGFDDLVIVDAVQLGQAAPGFAHQLDETALQSLPITAPHGFGLGETLALGRRLGMAMPSVVKILAVEVQDAWTVGTRLTPALESALPKLVDLAVAACLSPADA